MGYNEIYVDYVPFWMKKGGETVEGIVNAEKSVIHKPFSVGELNELAQKNGWNGNLIPDKLSEQEKSRRQERSRVLHEKTVRLVAKRLLEGEKAGDLYRQQRESEIDDQVKAGKLSGEAATQQKENIKTVTGTRYMEALMLDISGKPGATEKNAEMLRTYFDAENVQIKLLAERREEEKRVTERGEKFNPANYKPRELTEEEKAVGEKFNTYHRNLFQKIGNYNPEKLSAQAAQALKKGNDDFFVDHFEELQDCADMTLQFQNVRNAYINLHLTIPDDIKESMKVLEERLAPFESYATRLTLMDSPYYGVLDLDDLTTQEVLHSEALGQDKENVRDALHPAKYAEGKDSSDFQKLTAAMDRDDIQASQNESQALMQFTAKLGITEENLMVQVEGQEPKPYDELDFQTMYANRVEGISFYDKTDPSNRMEVSGALKTERPFTRALEAEREHHIPAPVKKPAEPTKPPFYKRVLNVFGLYKKDINDYNQKLAEYNTEKTSYEDYRNRVDNVLKETGIAGKTPKERETIKQQRKAEREKLQEQAKEQYATYQKEPHTPREKLKTTFTNEEEEKLKEIFKADEPKQNVQKQPEVKQGQPEVKQEQPKVELPGAGHLTDWKKSAEIAGGNAEKVYGAPLAATIAKNGMKAFHNIGKSVEAYLGGAADAEISAGDLMHAGVYQMFYDREKGNLQSPKVQGQKGPYEELGKTPSTTSFVEALQMSSIGKTTNIKVADFMKKMETNDGKIFSDKAVQEFKKNYTERKNVNDMNKAKNPTLSSSKKNTKKAFYAK